MTALDAHEGFRMLRALIAGFRSKVALARERDAAVESRNRFVEKANRLLEDQEKRWQRREAALIHEVELRRSSVEYLEEQLAAYRDALATFQVEAQLRGALSKADLLALTHPKGT